MRSRGLITVEGKVIAVLKGTKFRVELPFDKAQVLKSKKPPDPVIADISGRLRKNFIKITVGDKVKMEMSHYDSRTARITFRLQKQSNANSTNAPIRSYGPRRKKLTRSRKDR